MIPNEVVVMVRAARARGATSLEPAQVADLCAAYGIPTPAQRVARDVEEAAVAAAAIGFPVAMKVLSADASHKSDVGGGDPRPA